MRLIVLDPTGHTVIEENTETEFERLIRLNLGYVKTREGTFEQVRDYPHEAEEVYFTPAYQGG